MEVPCCSGVRAVVDKALERAGKKMPIADYTVTIQGDAGERIRRLAYAVADACSRATPPGDS
jgi:hypothetical protein